VTLPHFDSRPGFPCSRVSGSQRSYRPMETSGLGDEAEHERLWLAGKQRSTVLDLVSRSARENRPKGLATMCISLRIGSSFETY
jgi:hypothetical protein